MAGITIQSTPYIIVNFPQHERLNNLHQGDRWERRRRHNVCGLYSGRHSTALGRCLGTALFHSYTVCENNQTKSSLLG